MQHPASTLLIALSTLLLGTYALAWALSPAASVGVKPREILIHAIGIAGLVIGGMAAREVHQQQRQTMQLKHDLEALV